MTLKEKLDDLNNMIVKGEILESMDKYYHPDCVVMEKNDVVATGLEQAKDRESDLFQGVEAWLKSEIIATAVGDDVTMTEGIMSTNNKDLGYKKFDRVAVQHWKDGKVISDRFYALY
ncbi:MAG: nuclear transport factor 2 family protein [Nitrosospira sp.]|nr:nuclear transport factor 2 family protein [Nitrosospira sp.]